MAYSAYQMQSLTDGHLVQLEPTALAERQLRVKVHYSAINYKDALAVTGRGKILRQFPLTPGIDAVGEVIESRSEHFEVGDRVTLNGAGLGERYDGGFSQLMCVDEQLAMSLPPRFSFQQGATIGTAGITAVLCIQRLLQNGLTVEQGPVVVTGASGGVGSFAVAMLAQLGFEVIAVTGKYSCHAWLQQIGAASVVTLESLALGQRPLETARFAAAIDTVGGAVLAALLAHIQPWGIVTAVGMAAGAKLETTVMPFILRGVALQGVTAANCTGQQRADVWRLLTKDFHLKDYRPFINHSVTLSELLPCANEMLARHTYGRTLVQLAM